MQNVLAIAAKLFDIFAIILWKDLVIWHFLQEK